MSSTRGAVDRPAVGSSGSAADHGRAGAAGRRPTRARRPPADVLRLAAALARTPGLVRRLTRYDGMSLTSLATLATLERRGPTRVGELADSENVSQPAMTQLVSRLQLRGLLDRQPDAVDRRAVVVVLTDDGRDLLDDLRGARARQLADRMMILDPADRAALIDALPAIERLLLTD